jgi:hypothetical protein
MELYLHSSSTPSWRGAQLKHRDNFTFLPLPQTGPSGRTVVILSRTAPTLESWVRVPEFLSVFFCAVLSRVGRGLAKDRSTVKGNLPKCLEGFLFSEVISEPEQARGIDP